MQRTRFLPVILMLGLLLVGCRESAQPSSNGEANAAATISVEFTQQPARAGEDQLYIRVTDASGTNVPVAALNLRGDMTHAGMEPVISSYEEPVTDENGTYVIPFIWSMGGDWTLSVEAILQDGTTISEQVDLVVES